MTKRSGATIAAGALLIAGVFGGAVAPATAADTGWNGTRISSDADTGWNGTKVVSKSTKVKRAATKDSDTGWNGTRLAKDADTGWNGT